MPRISKCNKPHLPRELRKNEYQVEEQALVKELRELKIQTETRRQELKVLRIQNAPIL